MLAAAGELACPFCVHFGIDFTGLKKRLTGQQTRATLAVKRSQSVRLGRPPALDPKVRKAIRRARGRGHTFRKIANDLNTRGIATAHGGRCWHPATVRAALRTA